MRPSTMPMHPDTMLMRLLTMPMRRNTLLMRPLTIPMHPSTMLMCSPALKTLCFYAKLY